MQLTGTIQNRIADAIEFLKANRTESYDHNQIADVYERAGLPFTEAADSFYQEWFGVIENAYFYYIVKETNKFGKKGAIRGIDCEFYLYRKEEEIKELYDFSLPVCSTENATEDMIREKYGADTVQEFENDDFIGHMMRKKYGADTVPVAEGGHYYPGYIFVRPDGRLLIFHHDYDTEPQEYNNFFDLICYELQSSSPEFVEIILQSQELSGTLMDRIFGAVRFAKAHGGFDSCRLLHSYIFPCDTSQMPDDPELTDDELAKCLLQILQRQCSRPENIWPPTMIWHVLQ